MSGPDDESAGIYIPLPRTFFAVLGGAFISIGGGAALTVAPTINQAGIEHCLSSADDARHTAQTALDLARDALDVATQHGNELNAIRNNYYPAVDARREALDTAKEIERLNRAVERLK